MRVLVCGWTEFDDWDLLNSVLTRLYTRAPIVDGKVDFTIIEGGAKGADFLARVWAKFLHIPYIEFPADWKKYGKAAGPIRNQQQLDEGKPDIVVAFPGDRGTADMVRRAKKAGVEVIEVE